MKRARLKIAGLLSTAFLIGAVMVPSAATAADGAEDNPVVSVTQDGPMETITYEDGATFTSNTLARAGSFTWNADFSASLYSRLWSTGGTGDIWIDVGAISKCANGTIKLGLYRGDYTQVGTTRAVSCSGGSYVWRTVPQGSFRFQIWDNNTGDGYFPHYTAGKTRYV